MVSTELAASASIVFVSVIKGWQYTIGGWPQLRLSLAKDISKSSETVANGQSVYCKEVFLRQSSPSEVYR